MQTRAGVPTNTGPAFIAGLPIDKRVRRLVHTLNSIPGVTTYSSCGGHRNHLLAQVAAGSFYVMTALWLGRAAARGWGIALALMNEVSVLAYLISRPPEFGGDIAIVRTVTIASIVNLGIVGVLLFDGKLARFLGSTRLVGGWTIRR